MLQELSLLARLRVPAEREAELTSRLDAILAAFAALRAVDTSNTDATVDLQAGPAIRSDDPGPVLSPDQVLANAARSMAGAFVVPRVVDG